jgi:hypothetical protein
MFVGCKIHNGLNIFGHVIDGNHPAHDAEYSRLGIRRPIAGGYQITDNVPDDVWEKWLHENRQSQVVLDKMVLAHKVRIDLEQLCWQNAGVKGSYRAPSAF